MGVTHVTTRVRRLAGKGRAYEAEFLVDTGAIDCMAPVSVITSNATTDYHFKCHQVRYTFSPDRFQIHAEFVTAGNHVSAG